MKTVRHILFFGNSFTLYNGLPELVAGFAEVAGDARPAVHVQASYGWSLSDHVAKVTSDGSQNIIDASLALGKSWDDLVLQELSVRPTDATGDPVWADPSQFCADATALVSRVKLHSPNVKCVLYETWARGAASPLYPDCFGNPSVMQDQLQRNYQLAAMDLNRLFGSESARIAAVGEGWRRFNWHRDLFDGPDEYHPSQRGSLLAALTVFDSLYPNRVRFIPPSRVEAQLARLRLSAADWHELTGSIG